MKGSSKMKAFRASLAKGLYRAAGLFLLIAVTIGSAQMWIWAFTAESDTDYFKFAVAAFIQAVILAVTGLAIDSDDKAESNRRY